MLNGAYKLDYDHSKRTTNGVAIRHDGAGTSWWAFRSVCTTNGCAATGTALDDATHQTASTTDGGQTDTLHFVGGYWQGAPQQDRLGCTQPNGQVRATQQETVAWSLATASRRHPARHRDRNRAEQRVRRAGSGGAGTRGGHPGRRRAGGRGLGRSRPGRQHATAASAPAPPPVLGGLCSDIDKLAYDPTNSEQIVCEGNSWAKAPITMGVHASGSSCDRPGTSVFAMTTSNDGYLLQCDPVTRTWTRPVG